MVVWQARLVCMVTSSTLDARKLQRLQLHYRRRRRLCERLFAGRRDCDAAERLRVEVVVVGFDLAAFRCRLATVPLALAVVRPRRFAAGPAALLDLPEEDRSRVAFGVVERPLVRAVVLVPAPAPVKLPRRRPRLAGLSGVAGAVDASVPGLRCRLAVARFAAVRRLLLSPPFLCLLSGFRPLLELLFRPLLALLFRSLLAMSSRCLLLLVRPLLELPFCCLVVLPFRGLLVPRLRCEPEAALPAPNASSATTPKEVGLWMTNAAVRG